MSDWMSYIPNELSLAELSIPGTHNSASLYGGTGIACQTMELSDQLRAGIRFLDIRCRLYDNDLWIYHGPIYQYNNFKEVLKNCVDFLNAYPTETILMRVSQESTPYNSTQSFVETIQKIFDGVPRNRLPLDQCIQIPNLNEARGKIVLLRYFDGHMGYDYKKIFIEDNYNVPTLFHIQGKWDLIEAHLLNAKHRIKQNIYYLTYCSGSSAFAYPTTVSSYINPWLLTFLKGNLGKIRWGIIAMDYPSDELVKTIINSNFSNSIY